MAYNNPVSLSLQGDRVEAARYINVARAALWKLARATAAGGAASARRRLDLAGGVTIDLVLAGLQAQITITAPLSNAETWKPPQDFVVWARDAAHIHGIDTDYPEQILRVEHNEKHNDVLRWTTYFHDAGVEGFKDFPGRKGTYQRPFPDALQHGGNVDWRSPRGEIISWYGPSSRYWFDAYVQLRSQYGKFVFMNGSAILDVDAYIAASSQPVFSERYILGAALRYDESGTHLFTVQSEAPDMTTDTSDLPANTVEVTDPAPHTSQNLRFCRYTLGTTVDENGVATYHTIADSRITIGVATDFCSEPWFFNPECTEVLCHAYPPGFLIAKIIDRDAPPDPDDFAPADEIFPPTNQSRLRLKIEENAASLLATDVYSVTNDNHATVLASDYNADGEIVTLGLSVDENMVAHLEFGGQRHQLIYVRALHESEGDDRIRAELRWVVFADLREGLLVMMTYEVTFSFPGVVGGTYVEIYQNGKLVHRQLDHDVLDAPAHGFTFVLLDHERKYDHLKGRAIAPYFFVFGILFNMRGGPGTLGGDPEFVGCNYQFNWLGYPPASYFGTFDPPPVSPSPHPRTTIASRSVGGFASTLPDFDGHYSVTGCSFQDGVLLLSFATVSFDGAESFNFTNDQTLARLTGIGGTNARFHPIWRIGVPAKAPAGEA
jgi:hypothetical protein